MKPKVYLDYAAATPMHPEVLAAMQPYFSSQFYNPSAGYLSAKSAKKDLETARASVAAGLGAKPTEIIFCAGATEANNLAIQGVMDQFPDGELVISSVEHESILEPAALYSCRQLPVDNSGTIILNKLSNLVSDNTVLISVVLVSNELGTIQPIRQLSALVSQIRQQRLAEGNQRPLYLHTDAAQAGNYISLDAGRLGVDLLTVNGGKLYGPKQSGALYIKTSTVLKPQIIGGGQEYGLRSGTENVAGAVGFAKAFELAQAATKPEHGRVGLLRDEFESLVLKSNPRAIINSRQARRSPHISNIQFDAVDNERLMMELDEAGIECSVGSACSVSSQEPSHVLRAIGLTEQQTRSSLRFSFGIYTTQKDIKIAAQALDNLTVHNR